MDSDWQFYKPQLTQSEMDWMATVIGYEDATQAGRWTATAKVPW